MDIQTERVLIAFIDALFDDADDDCPKKKLAYELLESIRLENNQEIMDQMGAIRKVSCDPNCYHHGAH